MNQLNSVECYEWFQWMEYDVSHEECEAIIAELDAEGKGKSPWEVLCKAQERLERQLFGLNS